MKILVVVDMQNDFTTGALGNDECRAVVPKVAQVIAQGYDRIYVTRDTHQEDYPDTQEGRKLPVAHCIEGSEGWQLHPEIQSALDKATAPVEYIDKPTFGSMSFGEKIQKLGLEDAKLLIDFTGVCTGICVISNAMLAKAAAPEATIRIIKDACACVTPKSHQTALDAMQMCQMEIV